MPLSSAPSGKVCPSAPACRPTRSRAATRAHLDEEFMWGTVEESPGEPGREMAGEPAAYPVGVEPRPSPQSAHSPHCGHRDKGSHAEPTHRLDRLPGAGLE